jgi:TolB-like protein
MRLTLAWFLLLAAVTPLVSAQAASDPGAVLVLPFSSIGEHQATWLPGALRSNLANELARTPGLIPISPKDAPAADDPDSAWKLGENHRTTFVLYGSYQVVNNEIRLSAQVMDVANGRIIATTKTTGSFRDVFGMQDQLVDRCKHVLVDIVASRQPKPDPVEAFAMKLQQQNQAPKAAAAQQNGPWPWDVPNPEVEWARERLIYGRTDDSNWYRYPYPMYGGYGYGYGILYPINMGYNNGTFYNPNYRLPSSQRWSGMYFFPGGMIRTGY